MTTEILLRDAEATLRATVLSSERDGVGAVPRRLMEWFASPDDAPQRGPDAPLRSYDAVALAALEEHLGAPNQVDVSGGLQWLSGTALERSGLPAPILADAYAQLLLALAVRRRPELKGWFDGVLESSRGHSEPHWLAPAAGIVASGAEHADAPAEVVLALASLGVLDTDAPEREVEFLSRLVAGQLPSDPIHASTMLRALEWVRRAAPVAVPGRATVADLLSLLEGVQPGLADWTWETSPRKRGAEPVRWEISSEYHVQNLLWAVLRPVFPDLKKEEYVPSVGHHQPRTDLMVPSLGLVIEVKYLDKTGRSAWRKITEELKADVLGYLSSDSPATSMVVVLWDNTASTEQHHTFKQGLAGFDGVDGVVVLSRPGAMTLPRGSD